MSITIKAFGGKTVTRAPKGGFGHPVNGRSYKGGQFCPLYSVSGGSEEALTIVELSRVANALGSPEAIAPAAVIRKALAPLVEGTDRQKAAADDVRTRCVAMCMQLVAEGKAKGSNPVRIAEVEAKIAHLSAISSAPWWMDRSSKASVVAYILKEV